MSYYYQILKTKLQTIFSKKEKQVKGLSRRTKIIITSVVIFFGVLFAASAIEQTFFIDEAREPLFYQVNCLGTETRLIDGEWKWVDPPVSTPIDFDTPETIAFGFNLNDADEGAIKGYFIDLDGSGGHTKDPVTIGFVLAIEENPEILLPIPVSISGDGPVRLYILAATAGGINPNNPESVTVGLSPLFSSEIAGYLEGIGWVVPERSESFPSPVSVNVSKENNCFSFNG